MGYEARKFGVTRMLRGNDAKKKCPDIQLVYVPERRGKADLSCYRQAGAEVIQILSRFSDHIERASIDEAYLDITNCVHRRIQQMEFQRVEASMLPNTHVAGFSPSGVDSDSKGLDEHVDRVTRWEECGDNIDRPESVSCHFDGASGVEGGSDMLEETDVEMLDEEEVEGKEEEEDTVEGEGGGGETESEGGGSGNCREQLLAEWLKGGDLSLAVGALVAMEMRQAVMEGAGFTCSAGIAHNKACPPSSPTSPSGSLCLYLPRTLLEILLPSYSLFPHLLIPCIRLICCKLSTTRCLRSWLLV